MSSSLEGEREPLLNNGKDDIQQDWRHLSVARKRVIVATALLTGFLSALDPTVVATCIATISSELHSADQEAWIGTAYLWSSVTFTPLYGRLSDLIGRRAAYVQAVFIFTLGTLGCGVAPTFSFLITSRFIAGMGAIMGYICQKTLHFKWLTVLNCAGPVMSMTLFVTLRESSSWAAQWLSVVPMGVGFSGLLTLTLVGMLNSVEIDEIATATGFVFVWRSLGQVFGVGLSSAIFQGSLASQLNERFESPEIIDKLRHVFHAFDDLPEAWQRETAREGFRIALRNTFIFGLAGASLIPDDRLKGPEEGPIFAVPGTDTHTDLVEEEA
ncbi:hypothetical protein L486_04254 [Kwoniella mangroviensis CBS 10435]|uniref:Major facilitator superfamily (MFS) profile domain-containing protein n=1 Tax=Kwoniella mangroviensis CBS 10435 TaxID=1331196 RepID=A0A1B9IS37_9TREE|nr:hypothetical protein L486_04254 [Kwoniella mangroviensis CBS 10435]